MAAAVAPVLSDAATDLRHAQAWADRERELVKARNGFKDDDLDFPTDSIRRGWHEYLQRVQNSRNVFLAPLGWSAATVATGFTLAMVSARSLALRRSRRPDAEPKPD